MDPSYWAFTCQSHYGEYAVQQVVCDQLHIFFWHLQLLIGCQCLPCSDSPDKPVWIKLKILFDWIYIEWLNWQIWLAFLLLILSEGWIADVVLGGVVGLTIIWCFVPLDIAPRRWVSVHVCFSTGCILSTNWWVEYPIPTLTMPYQNRFISRFIYINSIINHSSNQSRKVDHYIFYQYKLNE